MVAHRAAAFLCAKASLGVMLFGLSAEVASQALAAPGAPARAGASGPVQNEQVLLQVGARGQVLQRSCPRIVGKDMLCSADGCTVLAGGMRSRSCADFCAESGYFCTGAWEEVDGGCEIKEAVACDSADNPTNDLLCQCAPGLHGAAPPATTRAPTATAPPAAQLPVSAGGAEVLVRTFFWNVHWECSMAAFGASKSCRQLIGERFVHLATAAKAQVVGSIELSDTMSKPASLVRFGLAGWTQVDGSCSAGSNGDAAALAFAPSWRVERSDGGCLRDDSDTRAFAVALATPPVAVEGCPSLCVVVIHAPHSSVTRGNDLVRRVCGGAEERCAMAMGDWNTPADGVVDIWDALIGGKAPYAPEPNERTCCWPESDHDGVFDHLATNVPGARSAGTLIHTYQLLGEHPVKQHRPVTASLLLPGASSVRSLEK